MATLSGLPIGSQGWASASASSMVALHSQVMSFILGCALLHQGSIALGRDAGSGLSERASTVPLQYPAHISI